MKELFALFYQSNWSVFVVILAGSILFGVVLDKIILTKLRKLAATTPWEVDDLLIECFHGLPFVWALLLGLYFALPEVHLPATLLKHGNTAVLISFLISLVILLSRIAESLVTYASRQLGTVVQSVSIMVTLAKWSVYLVGFLAILQTLGVSILPALTALGVGGLAISLALQGTLSNLFAGLQLTMSQQIQPGNFIRLSSGEEGEVVDIGLRNTTIRQLSNNIVIVPNAKLADSIITNFDKYDQIMSVITRVGVSYDSNLEDVEQIVIEVGKSVMQEVDGGVPDYTPIVRYHTFGESSVEFNVILQAQEFDQQYMLKHEFIKRLKKRFDAEGIAFPFPTRTVYIQDSSPHPITP